TLGPKGQDVIIESPTGEPKLTKDGVTVAKNIDLECPLEKHGANIIVSAAKKSDKDAGDGTTTTTVLTNEILKEIAHINTSKDKRNIGKGLLKAKKKGIEFLKQKITPIQDYNHLKNVATISANNDEKMGEIVAKAFINENQEIQEKCVVTITEGQSVETHLKKQKGVEIDSGYISPAFINQNKEQKCNLEKTYIFITNEKISNSTGIIKLLETYPQIAQGTLLVIAEDLDGEALSTIIINKLRGLKIAAIKSPSFGDRRKEILKDIAILTNGIVHSTESGHDLNEIDINHLGYAERITIDKNKTIITGGKGNTQEIEERANMIEHEIYNSTSDYDKEKLEERLANLQGKISEIAVGGDHDMQVSERKDRYQDAVNSAKAAINSGILPGGGTAHLRMSQYLQTLTFDNEHEEYGKQILSNALLQVTSTIMRNMKKTDYEIFEIISKILNKQEFHIGYDACNETICDMKENKIIDAAQVVINSIENAVSTAITILNTSAIIYKASKKNDEKTPPAMPEGGMMPGMY
ncbi:MAG: chaperonin GroEL, partial [Pseudomonadota bacterium]